jgi:beta-lactam-binding protein with PASTA domain
MKKHVRWLTYAGIALSVALVSGLVSFYVISKVIKVEVPDLLGRSRVEASRLIHALGLELVVSEEVFDAYVPEGYVIEQSIEPGTYVENDTEVHIVVSKGPEVRLIPSFMGKQLDEAQRMLLAEGLELQQIIRVHSDTVAKGVVIAQRPEPEEWTGETITLVASAGPYEVVYYCPEFTGMRRDDAKFLARQLSLKVQVEGDEGSGSEVVKQTPWPGTEIQAGNVVTLTFGGG